MPSKDLEKTSYEEIKFIQLNVGKARAGMANLSQVMMYNGVDVALIQEPYTCVSKVSGLPGHFKIYANNNDNLRVKTAIVVNSKSIDLILNTELSSNTIVVAHTIIQNIDTGILNCYAEPNTDFDTFLAELDFILINVNAKYILLTGDFNAKSRLWGNKNVNSKGPLLEAFISQYNLHIVNQGTTPTFSSQQGESVVDLTLSNDRLAPVVVDWSLRHNFHVRP